MDNNSRIDDFYNDLVQSGFTFGGKTDRSSYDAMMADDARSKKLYGILTDRGWDLDDYDTWRKGFSSQQPNSAVQNTGAQPNTAVQQMAQGQQSQPVQVPQGGGEDGNEFTAQQLDGINPINNTSRLDPKYQLDDNGRVKPFAMLETESTTDEQGNTVRRPKLVKGADGTDVYRNAMTGEEYSPLSPEAMEMVGQNTMTIDPNAKRAKDPSVLETIGKSLGAGFTRAGAGIVDVLQQLSSGMYVESGDGYIMTPSYEEARKDKNNAITKASDLMHETADRMSREAQPYGGEKGFLDLLWDGEIGKFAQKGLATAGESLPMTLSAYNPYTMVLNAISMAGSNYRDETIENPDTPAWKRASYAIGQAAIEQAVEKYADPVFKYIGGSKGKEVAEDITKEATQSIAKRIYDVLKDAAGEGVEEVATNFGNDALGEVLDILDSDKDYGIRAQWEKMKEENPNANLSDFAMAKAKENVEAFIGGALAGAYTSGTAQVSNAALMYAFGNNENVPDGVKLDPVTVNVAQSFDDGYSFEVPQEKNDAKNMYDVQRERMNGIVDEDTLNDIEKDPLSWIVANKDNLVAEDLQTVLDYVNAKATYDGMIQKVSDDIESQCAAFDELIDSRTNRAGANAGMLVPATMKMDDRQVFVIDGDIQMLDDGSMVDVSKSSESILVRDAETGKLEFVSPRDVLNVGEAVDAEQEKAMVREDTTRQMAQEQAQQMEGVLAFNAGDVYSILDNQGNTNQVEVLADNGDGTVMVSIDGSEPMPYPKDVLQQLSDNESKARAAERAAMNSAENATANGTSENGEGVAQPAADATGTVAGTDVEASGTGAEAPAANAEGTVVAEPMPMVGEGDNAEPDFLATTPERGLSFLFGESGWEESDADAFLANNVTASAKEVEKLEGKRPKAGTNFAKFNKDMAAWNASKQEAAAKAEYWQKMKELRDAMVAEKNAERKAAEQARQDAERAAAEQDEAAYRAEQERLAAEQARQDAERAAAEQDEAAYRAEQERLAAEQEARGANNVAQEIIDKWNSAEKVVGAADELVLPNGEKVKGHYVLVESGAASPSHDANNGFVKSEGFPVDVNGNSVNDRDYERDKDAQRVTRQMADNYDARAIQNTVVVSGDGVVLSGNGRTMAGELAAAQNTDGEYVEALKMNPGKFGFTASDMEGMVHPRVVFVLDEAMPYTAETFAKFNAQEMKSQSKTEQAVKLGKVVDDATYNRIVKLISGFERLTDFYNDQAAAREAISELQKAGVISDAQVAEMLDGEGISNVGRDVLENMLVGKAFDNDPDAVRKISELRSMRQAIIMALSEISANKALGEDYSLENELAQAIDLVYQARKSGGYKAGERVSGYARQGNLDFFGENATVGDITNVTVMQMADIINDNKPSMLKTYLKSYNEQSALAASGQLDLFSGGLESKQDILNNAKQLDNEQSERQEPGAASAEETGTIDNGGEGSEAGGPDGRNGSGNSKTAQTRESDPQEKVAYGLSTEKNEYGKSFVTTKNGSTEFGFIRGYEGLTDAPVKLSIGENVKDEKGTNHGYGLVHILAHEGREDAIKRAGFESVEDFVEAVINDPDKKVKVGHVVSGAQTYLVEVVDGNNNTLFIQLSKDGSYWNVNSAGIFRPSYSRNKKEVNTLPAVGSSAITDTAGVAHGTTTGEAITNGNSPLDKNESLSDGSAVITPTTDAASANVSTNDAQKSGEQSGSASNQSNSAGKGSNNSATDQTQVGENDLFSQNEGETEGADDNSSPVAAAIAAAEAETDTNPSEAQKEAGNYKKGHVKVDGYDITIENPKGSERSGKDADGKEWSVTMNNTYGYIRGTEGVDGDHIDVFLSDNPEQGNVYVVDQVKADGSFDEHKVMYGFDSAEEAREAYLANYSEGWTGLGTITEVSKEEFKKWIESSHRKTKPFSEYKSVKKEGAQGEEPNSAGANDVTDKDVERWLKEDRELRAVRSDGQNVESFDDYMRRVATSATDRLASRAYVYEVYGENVPEAIEDAYPYVLTKENAAEVARDLKQQQFDEDGCVAILRGILKAKSEAILPFLDEVYGSKNAPAEKQQPNSASGGNEYPTYEAGTTFTNGLGESMRISEVRTDEKGKTYPVVEYINNKGVVTHTEAMSWDYFANHRMKKPADPKREYIMQEKEQQPSTAAGESETNVDKAIRIMKEIDDLSSELDELYVNGPEAEAERVSAEHMAKYGELEALEKSMTDEEKEALDKRLREDEDELDGEWAEWLEAGMKEETGETITPDTSEPQKPNKPKKPAQRKPRKSKPSATTAGDEKIEDVGEKIGGARKDATLNYAKKIDLEATTPSKIFPKPNFASMEKAGVPHETLVKLKAYYTAFRITNKNKRKRNENQRILSARFYASIARDMLLRDVDVFNESADGIVLTEYGKQHLELLVACVEALDKKGMDGFFDLDFSDVDVNLGQFNEHEHGAYQTKDGKRWVGSYSSGCTNNKAAIGYKLFDLDDMEGLAEEYCKQVEAAHSKNVQNEIKMHVYRVSSGTCYISAKVKGIADEIKLKDGFATSKEAFDYLRENGDALRTEARAKADEMKQGKKNGGTRKPTNDDIERMLRNIVQGTRIGKDYRNGKDVSADDFMKEFGFRGVEFGNWATQKERQDHLNACYDALMDLADLIGISPKAISLGGKLAMAFGSRGRSSALAHYEPAKHVINLTKEHGAGCVAHEWFHAIDNYFGGGVFGLRMKSAVEGNSRDNLRSEMQKIFAEIGRALNGSDMKVRSKKLGNGDYWASTLEMAARAFESYVNERLMERGQKNQYLSAHVPGEAVEYEALAKNDPYPTAEESKKFGEIFDRLFDTVQEEVGDDGNVNLFQIADVEPGTENVTEAQQLATEAIITALGENAGIDVVMETREEGQRVAGMETEANASGTVAASERFDNELSDYKEKRHEGLLHLGAPGAKLRACGVDADNLTLSPKVLNDHLKKHNLSIDDLRGLAADIQDPILVYRHGDNNPNIVIVTEKTVNNGKLSISVELDEDGHVVAVNNVRSVHSKDANKELSRLAELGDKKLKESLRWVENEKVQDWLFGVGLERLMPEEASPELVSVAKILNDFNNPKLSEENQPNTAEFMQVWHGSAAIFDHFDGAFMGTGEGSQVYGDGHYVTGVESTGRMYATIATENRQRSSEPIVRWKGQQVDFSSVNPLRMAHDVADSSRTIKEARDRAERYADMAEEQEMKNKWSIALDILKQSTKADFKPVPVKGNRQLYEVEIPDDNGKNYLNWNDAVPVSEQDKIEELLFAEVVNDKESDYTEKDRKQFHDDMGFGNKNLSVGDLYGTMTFALGSKKAASALLRKAGFVGVKVPTGNRRGGDGRGMNYVIFNDNDLKITDRVQFMQRPEGTVYGWSEGNRIHLTPEGINPNTPIHEYTHLWAKAVMQKNPKLWNRIKELLQGTPIWDEVVNDPAYQGLTSDDAIASEALSRLSGRNNATKMEKMAQDLLNEAKGNGVFAEANAHNLILKMKQALKDFWKWVGTNLFDMTDVKNIDEVTDRVLYDMLNKTDLEASENGDAATEFQVVTDEQVNTPQFKKWFGDWEKDPEHSSKVVDAEGKPMVVYHGTQLMEMYFKEGRPYTKYTERFNTFNDGKGFFTSDRDAAESFARGKQGLYETYLNIRNPYVIDCKGKDWDAIEGYDNPEGYKTVSTDYIVNDIKRNHPEYDGVIFRNVMNENNGVVGYPIDDYVPFKASQIKSATENNGEFDPANPDIRFRERTEFDDGEVLDIVHDTVANEYSLADSTMLSYQSKEQLLRAFQEKHPSYAAVLTADGNGIEVMAWKDVLKHIVKNRRSKNGEPTKAEKQRAAYVERKTQIAIKMVNEKAQKLGLNVEVLTDTEGLPEKLADKKGWYNKATGKITIVLPNHFNGLDVMRTLMHEGVAHHGLRQMFGKDFDTFLDNVYANADIEVRRKIAEMAARKGWDFHTATEEYLAALAEDMDFERNLDQMWWQKVKFFFVDMLRKAGIVLGDKLTDNDLRFILWKSYEHMAYADEYGAIRDARTEVMKQELGVGNYAPSADAQGTVAEGPKSAKQNTAADGSGLLFRDGDEDTTPLSLHESMIQGLIDLAQKNKENAAYKTYVVKAIGGELAKLRKAMSAQKEYDRSTVEQMTGLARLLIKNGMLSNMSEPEMLRLLTIIKNATGRNDITKAAQQVYDLMIKNQLEEAKNMLDQVTHVRGSKVNAQGVEVQGTLDVRGQQLIKAFRKAMSLDEANISELLQNASDRMDSPDAAIADEAATEYAALTLALQYVHDIKDSVADEKLAKEELEKAREAHAAKTDGLSAKAYKEYVQEAEDAIRQKKLERIEAYHNLAARLAGAMQGSIESAKQFREREMERVKNIHHFANSDLQGRPANAHRVDNWKQKVLNNPFFRFMFNPLGTFDQMLRMIGNKSVNGEGYLYNHFMRGWLDATQKEFENFHAACKVLDDKASEVFGKKMRWSDLYAEERKMPKAQITFTDVDGSERTVELNQGNLLYIYMAEKMADGRMKLRAMGITEEDIDNIKEVLDPRFVKLADWLQEEFLVQKRNDYNAVHERMFGAPMAAIENYFPLRIRNDARVQQVDVAEDKIENELPSILTGSIIKRRTNNKPLDVMNTDAFSVVVEHLQQMEKWAAFAEWRRDLNTLLSYTRFRNQLKNMSSIYGAGDTLWRNFMIAGSIAAGTHRPNVGYDGVDTTVVNLAKGVTTAKISFRVFTAIKQLLSAPAFMAEANWLNLAKSIATPWKAWNWAMEELPTFKKRWQSKQAGDSRLMKTDVDWRFWKNRLVETLSRWGMSPNAFVDAMTVAIGGRAIYETKYARYIEDGYSEAEADKKAKQDAAVLVNQTQQSSETAFVSKMQLDRTVAAVSLSVFRNSPMSYQRQLVDAIRGLKRMATPGYKEESIDFMAKQMVRDGLDEDAAKRAATRAYNREWVRNLSRTALFGFGMQMAWNLGAYLPYLIFGDDDDEKKEMLEDAAVHGLFGSIEGLSGGNLISELGNMKVKGESLRNYDMSLLPLMSDIRNIYTKLETDEVAAVNDMVNLLVQSGIGVNPQTITDAIVAITDACNGDVKTGREATMLFLRLSQAPQSQIDKLYLDEIGMRGKEASKLSVQDLAKRYAQYKKNRNAPLTQWAYGDEAEQKVIDKHIKKFETQAKERLMQTTGDAKLDDAYEAYEENYKDVKKRLEAVNKLKDEDFTEFYTKMGELASTPEFRKYDIFKGYKSVIDKLKKAALDAKDGEEREHYLQMIDDRKRQMVERLDAMK